MTTLVWGSPQWFVTVGAIAVIAALLLVWSYTRAPGRPAIRLLAASLKMAGFLALLICLVEPMLAGRKPRRGANAFVVLADNSQSMTIRDGERSSSRGDWLRDRLVKENVWKTRLEQDFDVRRYTFDSNLRAVDQFEGLAFDGVGSSIATSLNALAKRFRGLPIAGVLVFTDGLHTDTAEIPPAGLPPIFPVIPPSPGRARDIAVRGVSVTATNFEAAPVVVRADVVATGYRGQSIVSIVTDESGRELGREVAQASADGQPIAFRFQFRPEKPGLGFYRVRAFAADAEQSAEGVEQNLVRGEQTGANNSRLIVVDQGGGPYRVLYVSGRPDPEFKFLRRALEEDEQVQLVGLIRIARKQPKFDFQSKGNRTSRFYEGFNLDDPDLAERADQPVLVRLGTRDADELRDGFPRSAEELDSYHAMILDDLESSFFTPDQLALLRNFVAHRGGGFLMLGGPDSFAEGRYDRTPIGDLLPVYLDRTTTAESEAERRLVLTREGELQPWVRLRKTEDEEAKRLAGMPGFRTVSASRGIKPGAVTLAEARDPSGQSLPALVAQPFGKGRVGALLVGGLWRWGLHRDDPSTSDLERSWRQTVRWLVGDVPRRVEIFARPKEGASSPTVDLRVRVRDAEYRPLDNAHVALSVMLPDGRSLAIDAEPESREPGTYAASYVAREPGPYRVTATATGPEGAEVGRSETGWAAQPAADEFAQLEPNRDWLAELARKTGGELVDGDRLPAFVASLASRDAPIQEPWVAPIWHQPLYFLIAIVCLAAEWGIRRVHGLP